jgi:hypothetical protein
MKSWHKVVRKDSEPHGGFQLDGHEWDKAWLEFIRPLTDDRTQWKNLVQQLLGAELGWIAFVST